MLAGRLLAAMLTTILAVQGSYRRRRRDQELDAAESPLLQYSRAEGDKEVLGSRWAAGMALTEAPRPPDTKHELESGSPALCAAPHRGWPAPLLQDLKGVEGFRTQARTSRRADG
jgi:hypothetical protein